MTNLNKAAEMIYWHSNPDWYSYVDGNGMDGYRINPDAPEEAKRSFAEWKKHREK